MWRKLVEAYKNILTPKGKLARDVRWNTLSFAAMGISGIVLNVLIVMKYGAETLGVFNQVYAVYILASQFAVFGLYAPVLKYVSEHSENKELCNKILTSALLLCFATATIVSLGYYASIDSIGRLLNSPNVARGMFFSLIGLWCFAFNKIILAFLNGKRLMRAFAFFNSFRLIAMVLFLVVFMFLGLPGYFSPAVFSFTEVILLIILLVYVFAFRLFKVFPIKECREWFKTHIVFGSKSIIGGAISEINTRIDVFMLGIFSADRTVGIYSLAAMLADGLNEVPGIFRVNFNPLLVKFIVQERFKELREMIKGFFRKWIPVAVIAAFAAVVAFPVIVKIIAKDVPLSQAWIVFIILIFGVFVKSGYAAFWDLPTQAGHPGYQTLLICFTAASNVLLNYILIPHVGLYGAAVATSASFILSIFFLKSITKKLLGIKI